MLIDWELREDEAKEKKDLIISELNKMFTTHVNSDLYSAFDFLSTNFTDYLGLIYQYNLSRVKDEIESGEFDNEVYAAQFAIEAFSNFLTASRSVPLNITVSVQSCESEGVSLSDSSPENVNLFDGVEFLNPFSVSESIERVESGGFNNLADFLDVGSRLKSLDSDCFKKWWLEDGSKPSAMTFLDK